MCWMCYYSLTEVFWPVPRSVLVTFLWKEHLVSYNETSCCKTTNNHIRLGRVSCEVFLLRFLVQSWVKLPRLPVVVVSIALEAALHGLSAAPDSLVPTKPKQTTPHGHTKPRTTKEAAHPQLIDQTKHLILLWRRGAKQGATYSWKPRLLVAFLYDIDNVLWFCKQKILIYEYILFTVFTTRNQGVNLRATDCK